MEPAGTALTTPEPPTRRPPISCATASPGLQAFPWVTQDNRVTPWEADMVVDFQGQTGTSSLFSRPGGAEIVRPDAQPRAVLFPKGGLVRTRPRAGSGL